MSTHLTLSHSANRWWRLHRAKMGAGSSRPTISICPDGLFDVFRDRRDLDFSFEIEADPPQAERHRPAGMLCFRANFFLNQQILGTCFRLIPSFEWAGFPEGLAQRLAHFRDGLVLLTSVAGSGKTTTLARIIALLNHEGNRRIITIEEPVEYQFPKCPARS